MTTSYLTVEAALRDALAEFHPAELDGKAKLFARAVAHKALERAAAKTDQPCCAAEELRNDIAKWRSRLERAMDEPAPDDGPDYLTQLRDEFAMAVLPAVFSDWMEARGEEIAKIPERAWGVADAMISARGDELVRAILRRSDGPAIV